MMGTNGEIKFSDGHGNHWCMAVNEHSQLVLDTCAHDARHKWAYDASSQHLTYQLTGLCLDSGQQDPVTVVHCNGSPEQRWHFTK